MRPILSFALAWLLAAGLASAERAIDLDLGPFHGCALYDTGEVYCWGDAPGQTPRLPVAASRVEGLPPVWALATGNLGSCAIDRDGALWCWGVDVTQSLETQSFVTSDKPVAIRGLPRVHSVAMGYSHICAIADVTREVWCWGSNDCGEVGCGDTEPRSLPTKVPYVAGATSISAGVNNTCVVFGGGQLSCWGSDNPTRQGDPFVFETTEPILFASHAIPPLASVSNGRNFSCGIGTDGRVTCWGSNIMGQIGTREPRLGLPFSGIGEVDGLDRATDVDASYFGACAVQDGDVHCWGNVHHAKSGGDYADVTMREFGSAEKIGVGAAYSCAVVDGRVLCWGRPKDGTAAIPGMSLAVAVPVPGLPGESPADESQQRPIESTDELRDIVRREDYDQALDLLGRLRAQGDAGAELDEIEAKVHFELGFAAKADGDADLAFTHYTRAIEISGGTHGAALNNRALILAKRGENDRAIADILTALDLRPTVSLYHANHCLFLRLKDDLEAAVKACDRALEVGLPRDQGTLAWVQLQRGTTSRLAGDMDGAVAAFVAAVAAAESPVVERIQGMMTEAGLYRGPIDGTINAELETAIETCTRNDACFDQSTERMSDILGDY